MIQENERNVNFQEILYNRMMRLALFGSLCLVALLLANVFLTIDPDFGWHLQMGNLIAHQGIPYTDPFSYTMPSYSFIDHEWLSDVFFAAAYPYLHLAGLSILFVLLVCGSVGLLYGVSEKRWFAVPSLLTGLCLASYTGVRPQLFSWIFFSCLLVLFFKPTYWKKFRWGVPFLFLLWANMHGAFALGVTVLFIFLVTKMITDKKILLVDSLIFLITLFVTIVNPYGLAMWKEVWISLSDPSLRWSIQEWMPAFVIFNSGFTILLPVSISFFVMNRKHFSLTEGTLFFVLLLLSITSNRHIPFFALMALPVTTKGIGFFYASIQKDTISRTRFITAYKGLLCLVIFFIFIPFGFLFSPSNAIAVAQYPSGAIAYLKQHPSQGNLFAEYDWGGYLIWQYPQKKVFVDGRMPSWKNENASKGESTNAFGEYEQFFSNIHAIPLILQKYDIDTVLLEPQRQTSLVSFVSFFGKKPVNVTKVFSDLGYYVVYQDATAVVYRKK